MKTFHPQPLIKFSLGHEEIIGSDLRREQMQSVIKNSGKASASARMLMPEATTQVTLHDVDRFPVALREKMLQKQDLTSRTISSYDHILYRARPSLAVSSACVHCLCVCVCAVRAVSMLWSPSATSF